MTGGAGGNIALGVVAFAVFAFVVLALAARQNRASPGAKETANKGGSPKKSKAKKFKGGSGKSHVVTFLNSTGATDIKSRKLSHAAAEVAGKVTGKAVRAAKNGVKKAGVGRGASWVGSKWKDRAGARWDRRVVSDGHQPLIWRDRTSLIAGDMSDPSNGSGPRSTDGRADSWSRAKYYPSPNSPSSTKASTDTLVAGRKDGPSASGHTTVAAANPKPSAITAIIPGGHVTAPAETARANGRAAVPPYFAQLVGYVANFEPEDDKDLIQFMAAQAAGISAYAEAMVQAHETCLRSIGLDPASIAGLADFADATSESGVVMTRAHRKFLAVYNEVLQAVANGVLLPRNGRFITGQAS